MKWILSFNESTIIKATDETIMKILSSEIDKLGNNAHLNHIDVSEVTSMNSIFSCIKKFNGDISKWDVGNVRGMSNTFRYSRFNGDISGWNVENVMDMRGMFIYSAFNGHISNWNIGNVQNMTDMFHRSLLKGREPWWYILYPIFGSPHLMWDSLDFRWIDIERKIIYREKLSKILLRSYNRNWNGELPGVFGFTYKQF